MKNGNRTPTGLAVTVAAIALICYGLWMILAARQTVRLLSVLGGVIALAAALLIVVFHLLYRQSLEREDTLLDEMEELERSHEKEMQRCILGAREDMEQFRNGLAHSLRMPVSIIQGYAELLAGGVLEDPEVRQEYLEKIVQRSRDMTETMSRQFSEKEAMGSEALSVGKLDLLQLIRRAAADLQAAAEGAQVLIQVICAEDSIPMQADACLLNRVIFNLLENSLKYMGRPGVVAIRVMRREGERVCIVVQDDGMGLPAAETEHIFEARFQGSNHVGGSGYGLYLVRQAVEAHGGTVSAQSAPGRGMGITIELPLAPEGDPIPA